MEWKLHTEYLLKSNEWNLSVIDKPKSFDKMKEAAKMLEFEYAVRDEGKSGAKYMTDAIAQQIMNNSRTENIWSTGRAFTFGLASYFFPRYYCHGAQSPKTFFNNAQDAEDGAFSDDSTKMLNQWWEQNKRTSGMAVGDQMRDMMAAQRILPHIDAKLDRIVDDDMDSGYSWKVSSYGIAHRDVVLREYNGIEYYNSIITFRDGWDRALHYSSKPPYDKYELWSSGADGTSGTEDDIYAGQE